MKVWNNLDEGYLSLEESDLNKEWHEECGVMGVWDHEDAARLTYLGLYAIQHRGQESAGIVSLHQGQHLVHKGLGLVGDVFPDEILKMLEGNVAIGHVRYSTTGQNLLSNAQPLTASLLNGPVAVAHNGNIVNTTTLKQELQAQGAIFQGTNDTEVLLHLISHVPSNDIIHCLKEGLKKLVGAYSLVLLTHKRLIVVRDPYGFRPLVLGRKKNKEGRYSVVVASETCAFDLIQAEYVREIQPGEIFWVEYEQEGSLVSIEKSDRIPVSVPKLARCVFEHVYFSRPDSIVFGESVYEVRKRLGRWLARENPVEADVVIPVPDSGVPSAIGYSQESGIPFELGIIRNHYVGRTFIQPHQSVRSLGVRIKLNPQMAILKDKRVVVIDDSLVRGTTSQKIVRLIRQAGAKEIHMRIASPPTVGPCYYGVDTPKRTHLIAAQQSIDEIRSFIEADTLCYLSLEGLLASTKSELVEGVSENANSCSEAHSSKDTSKPSASYCSACFDGCYPTQTDTN